MAERVPWFAARLKALRERVGLSQRQLAAKAGISKGTISDLETSRRIPNLWALLKLARVLGGSLSVFDEAPPPEG
jgi:transcriptional regulator with XRE-family HTH domain